MWLNIWRGSFHFWAENKEIMAEIFATMTKIIKPRIHKTNLKYDYLKDCTGTCNNQISENQYDKLM